MEFLKSHSKHLIYLFSNDDSSDHSPVTVIILLDLQINVELHDLYLRELHLCLKPLPTGIKSQVVGLAVVLLLLIDTAVVQKQ